MTETVCGSLEEDGKRSREKTRDSQERKQGLGSEGIKRGKGEGEGKEGEKG